LVSASADNTARLWDIDLMCERLRVKERHTVYSVAVNRTGDKLMCCLYNQVNIWDITMSAPEIVHSMVNMLIPSPLRCHFVGSQKIVGCKSYEVVQVWDVVLGFVVKAFSFQNLMIYAIALHPVDAVIAIAVGKIYVFVWHCETGVVMHRLCYELFDSLCFSFDRMKLAFCGGFVVGVWNTLATVPNLVHAKEQVEMVVCTADENAVAVLLSSNRVMIFNVQNCTVRYELTEPGFEFSRKLSVSPAVHILLDVIHFARIFLISWGR
jgi:hypothetical protein